MDTKPSLRILGFETQHRPGRDPVDMVHVTSRDALSEQGTLSHSTWHRIRDLIPPEGAETDAHGALHYAAMRHTWAQIEPAYKAWKAGNEIPDTGTPLGAWPGVTPAQAEVLRSAGLRTVEDVAGCPEGLIARGPLPNMRALKRLAASWLEGRDKSALEAKLAEQSEKQDAMLAMLEETQAERETLQKRIAELEAQAAKAQAPAKAGKAA